MDNQYRYDHNGNCIEMETHSGRIRYDYDSMNRLAEAAYPWGRETFAYDYADNRRKRESWEWSYSGGDLYR